MNMRFCGEYHRLLLLLLLRDTGALRETTSALRSLSGCLGGLVKKFTWPSQLLRRNQDVRSLTSV
jgi:hypothetical protein